MAIANGCAGVRPRRCWSNHSTIRASSSRISVQPPCPHPGAPHNLTVAPTSFTPAEKPLAARSGTEVGVAVDDEHRRLPRVDTGDREIARPRRARPSGVAASGPNAADNRESSPTPTATRRRGTSSGKSVGG